jgi:hypothetical protein
MWTRYSQSVVGVVCAAMLAGCSAAPRQRPVKMGPAETNVESARRQLQGLWDLVSLDLFPKPGAAAVPVKAQAVLSYDEFGNLSMKGKVAEESRRDPTTGAFLDYSGKAVIDVTSQQLRLTGVSGNNPVEDAPAELSFKSVRKYSIEGDLLKVSTVDTQGNITATSVWKRRAQ